VTRYADIDHDSGIEEYWIENDSIEIRYKKNPTIFRYDSTRPGKQAVEHMKVLAVRGDGLHAYINSIKHLGLAGKRRP
jgi:hypothetical protein